jgi:GAF domain-containing protein
MSLTRDSTLADPQQIIANLKRERDEAKAERDEALAQQSATAEVLEVINSSPGDLKPVFDAILEKATRVCEAVFGTLLTWDGERFHWVAFRGLPTELVEALRQVTLAPGKGRPVADRIVRGEMVISMPDLREEAHRGVPVAQAFLRHGARSCVTVALRKEESLLGLITIYREEVRPFTDKQIALLQSFAAQAVIAIENARLLDALRQRTGQLEEALEQQTATAEVLGVINTSPGDLTPVFDTMLEKATVLCDAGFGIMLTWDGECFHRVAFRGVPAELIDALRQPTRPVPGSMAEQVVNGATIISAADIRESPAYRIPGAPLRPVVDIGGARSYVAVALRSNDTLLGIFSIYRREVRPFTDKQIALLQNFAAQAVIAMENARLITETREALEQQTATADVLQVINTSPGDLSPVFNAMLEKAMRLCEAAFGELAIIEGGQSRIVTTRGVPAAFAKFRSQYRASPLPGSITARIFAGEPVVQTIDAADSDAYRDGEPHRRAMVDLGGARTSLAVTLMKDHDVLGALHVYRQEVRPFTDKQIALLQNFAAQAVIAMENARLITETREALEQQTATAEVLQVINSSPGDLTPVFEVVLEKAHSLCGAVHGILATYDGEHARAVATHGIREPSAEVLRQPFRPTPNSAQARVVREGRPIHIPDLMTETLWERDDPKRIAAMKAGGVRTMLFVPLRKDDIRLGWITANRLEVRPFSNNEIVLLESFAAQAVIAMENARLLGELRQRTDEVAELNRGLEARVAEQVDELGRVGRLKRFLAPQLAELIVSHGDENILESHRREIVVVFCDLRGYTAFTETAEPEEVLDFLREYHGALGPLVSQFEGTLDQFSGDGIMVFFNDPVPVPDPAERAVKMAVAMREAAGDLIAAWRRRGRELGYGAGIAQGYATLGQIGFAERSGYTAIGTVCNVAARLCAEAKDGQILLSQRVAVAVEGTATLEDIGALTLKGLTQPVVAFNVR